jgi:integrase
MRRSNPKDRARDRILTDDELRAVWKQAEANGVFGALVRVLLLTGQRLEKVRTIQWDDLHGDTWLIRTETREKGNAGELKLPQTALDIINAQPRFASNPYVFASKKNGGAMAGDRERKRDFVAKLPPMPEWRLHDLRRTARSLMSRAGVRPDVAERVLGHAMGGVEGIYDRHRYTEEKGLGLKSLAALIERIVNRPAANVIAITG